MSFFVAVLLLVSAPLCQAQEATLPFTWDLEVEPRSVSVGEPVRVSLRLEASPAVGLEVDQQGPLPLAADDPRGAWVLLDTLPPRRESVDGQLPRVSRLWTWTLTVLEPGEQTPASLLVHWDIGDGARVHEVPVPSITFRGELAEGETEPRPLVGLVQRPLPEEPGPHGAWFAVPSGLALLALGLYVRRRKAQPEVHSPLPFASHVEAAEGVDLDDPDAVRSMLFAWTKAVRLEVEQRVAGVQAPLAGATDEEWVEELGLGQAWSARAQDFFATSAAIKYGFERPTRFAAKERIVAGQALVASLPASVAQSEGAPK